MIIVIGMIMVGGLKKNFFRGWISIFNLYPTPQGFLIVLQHKIKRRVMRQAWVIIFYFTYNTAQMPNRQSVGIRSRPEPAEN